MFPVLRYIPTVLQDPGAWARQGVLTVLDLLVSILLGLYSYVLSALTFGVVAPRAHDAGTLTSTLAAFYATACDGAAFSGVSSLANAALAVPSLVDITVLLAFWIMTCHGVTDFALRISKAVCLEPVRREVIDDVDEELNSLRDQLDSIHEKTTLKLAANKQLRKDISDVENVSDLVADKIEALRSNIDGIREGRNRINARLASAEWAKRTAELAQAERQKGLQTELADQERELVDVGDRVDQVRREIKEMEDTEKVEEDEAANALLRESQLIEAQMAEAQTMFDHSALALELAIADVESACSQSHDEAARLEAAAQVAREEHDSALEQANIRLKTAEDELVRLETMESALETARSAAEDEYQTLLLQLSIDKCTARDAEYDDTIAEAAFLSTFTDHDDANAQTVEALEKEVADLEKALREANIIYDGYKGSLEFSVAEHRFHMEICNKESKAAEEEILLLNNQISTEQVAAAEALSPELALTTTEYEEELKGLEWRISQVEEGRAAEEARTRELRKSLDEVCAARVDEDRAYRLAILACQRTQREGDEREDALIRAIDEQKARGAAIEAEVQRAREELEAVQRRLAETGADQAEADEELAAREAERAELAVEVDEARRREKSFRREVEGQEKAYANKLGELKRETDVLRARIDEEARLRRRERSGRRGQASTPFYNVSNFMSGC